MDWVLIWAIVIAVALMLEFFSMQLISIWFSVGGIVSLILASIGGISPEIQIICALIVSIGCILGIRKFALKYLHKRSENKTAEPLIGRKTKTIESCSDKKLGSVKINGIIWTTYSDTEIEANEYVEVTLVNGNKLKVEKIKGDK
ncbi:MAG: NfeD family protein [Clostridia bacterium]|nr:NfeD family protein [Clostridia bacterium]MDD4685998.1 NfeD family protein [Clostridia bacterium]